MWRVNLMYIWASLGENLTLLHARSACASAQSDQHLYYWGCYIQKFNILASLCSWACRIELCLVTNPKDLFSSIAADMTIAVAWDIILNKTNHETYLLEFIHFIRWVGVWCSDVIHARLFKSTSTESIYLLSEYWLSFQIIEQLSIFVS